MSIRFLFRSGLFILTLLIIQLDVSAFESNELTHIKIIILNGKEDSEGGNEAIINHSSAQFFLVEYLPDSITKVKQILDIGFALLPLPSTIGSWRVSEFCNLPVPIIAWEYYAFDKELFLVDIDPLNYGCVPFALDTISLVCNIKIVYADHPLSDNLPIMNKPAIDKLIPYYFHHTAPLYLTTDGWRLFDTAIKWAISE